MAATDVATTKENWHDFVEHVLQPLVGKDAGQITVLSFVDDVCVLRLMGKFRGCPGTPLVIDEVILPLCRQRFGTAVKVSVQPY